MLKAFLTFPGRESSRQAEATNKKDFLGGFIEKKIEKLGNKRYFIALYRPKKDSRWPFFLF
jgi:hypothetical protein